MKDVWVLRATRRFGRLLASAALGALIGCAALLGPRTVEVSQAQLQQLIDRQFPLHNRLLDLLDVDVATPRLRLLPDANRLATEFDVTVSDRLFRQPHRGTIALDYGLRFEPTDATVRLTNVRIERVAIDGTPAWPPRSLDRLVQQLAEQVLNDRAIYTLRAQDVEAFQGRGYRAADITVTPRGLAITLLPDDAR